MEKIEPNQILDKLYHLESYQYAILGVGLLLLLILIGVAVNKSAKKARAKKVAPLFTIDQLLIAPLGMGVQIKLKNSGFPVTILKTEILDRANVNITQGFENYLLETGKVYTVFCEATDRRRADSGFKLSVKYKNQLNTILQQEFYIEATQSKLLKMKFA